MTNENCVPLKRALGILALVLLARPCPASDTGAAFLKIAPGARAVGMGGAFTALANDTQAFYWNPAGLGLIQSRQLGASHVDLFQGISLDQAALAHPFRGGTLGYAVTRLSPGDLEGRDDNRQPTGSFTASDIAAQVDLGFPALGAFWGLGVKAIQSRVADISATGAAMDAGVLIPAGPLRLGLAVQNLGRAPQLGDVGTGLPTTISAGLALPSATGLTFALDVRRNLPEERTSAGVGMELPVLNVIFLRAGYLGLLTGPTFRGDASGEMRGIGAGFGLRILGINLDYAMTPFGELGNVQRFSLGARF